MRTANYIESLVLILGGVILAKVGGWAGAAGLWMIVILNIAEDLIAAARAAKGE